MKIVAKVFFGLLGLSISIVASGGKYTDQAKAQLRMAKLAVATEGYEETHEDKFGSLDDDDSDSFSFNLSRGKSYLIVSFCDEDCSDLDLILYDKYDNELSKDTQTDSAPMVSVTPRYTGSYTLKVTMYSCDSDPCFYGISILGK